jgi:DNA-binding NtrC family response regulator
MSERGTVLVVDDEEKIRNILVAILKDEGYGVVSASDGITAIEQCRIIRPQVAIVDLQMPRMDGIQTCTALTDQIPNLVPIILTAHGSIQSAVQAIKQGVYDYVTKPFDNDQLVTVVNRAFEHHRLKEEVNRLRQALGKEYGVSRIIGDSETMQRLRDQIRQMAQTDATVLIEGESGTGKELAARAIHYESKRANNPLVIIDCAAVPPNLIESEFFGHERGAFTDARERTTGKFEEADTGTIFLDEVGELPLDAQVKLLRVLQEREFSRVGSVVPIRVDVRIIAATNKNLLDEVRRGKFREDLFYRLDVLSLTIPPLREHCNDIPVYVQHFASKYQEMFGKSITDVADDALALLMQYDWKGNIRELENAIQRAMLSANGDRLTASDFSGLINPAQSGRPMSVEDGLDAYVRSIMNRTERQIIIDALKETNGNRTAAAEKLKVSRKTLFNKMQQYGIE